MTASAVNPIPDLLERYRAAVFAKDVEAFAALYASDVRVFDLWGRWAVEGLDAWRAMASEWFASLNDERVAVDVRELTAQLGGELAAGQAFISYTALAADGRTLRSLDNRISLVARRDGDTWRIVHEHTSAPIDHATLKAALRRPPA